MSRTELTGRVQTVLGLIDPGDLGLSATELSGKLDVSQPSVSISARRGERIAEAERLEFVES